MSHFWTFYAFSVVIFLALTLLGQFVSPKCKIKNGENATTALICALVPIFNTLMVIILMWTMWNEARKDLQPGWEEF